MKIIKFVVLVASCLVLISCAPNLEIKQYEIMYENGATRDVEFQFCRLETVDVFFGNDYHVARCGHYEEIGGVYNSMTDYAAPAISIIEY